MEDAYVIEEMIGSLFDHIHADQGTDDDQLVFSSKDLCVRFFHIQDCCESVYIEDIIGDLQDLKDSPLTMAECVKIERGDHRFGTYTSTWYKFATVKGYVSVRWKGESNGYYSEGVDFRFEHKAKDSYPGMLC